MSILSQPAGDDVADDSGPARAPLAEALGALDIPDPQLAEALGLPAPQVTDPDRASEVLGVNSASEDAVDIGALIWLVRADAPDAEVARALVFGEGDLKNSACGLDVAKRLSDGAAWWCAVQSDERLIHLAALSGRQPAAIARWRMGVGGNRRVTESVGARAGDADHLEAMMAAGMTPAQLAPMALADPDGLTGDYLVRLLSEADLEVVFAFIGGESQRRPRPGELRALLSALAHDQNLERAIIRNRDDLPSLPWMAELIESLPGIGEIGLSTEEAWAVYGAYSRELGEDVGKWTRAVEIGEVWTGAFGALAEAVAAGL